MKALLIIIGIIVLIVILSRNKKKQPAKKTSSIPDDKRKNFKTQFPDRTASFGFFKKIIEESIENGEIDIANLNFAKLVEALRQQNINENGKLENDIEIIKKKYSEFRDYYNVDYPQQFLPPEERKKAQSKYDNEFVLLTTLNYDELPKQILKHIDKVKTVKEWQELKLSPKKEQYGGWKSIKRQEMYFDFEDIELTDEIKEAIKSSKRITKNPYYIAELIEQGCDISEFAFVFGDIEFFINSVKAQEESDFENALLNIKKAIEINPLNEYLELESDLKARLGDLDTIQQKFKEHEFDIDSPVHSGEIYNWLKGLVLKNEYALIMTYIEQTNDILDKLSSGKIKAKIYGQQNGEWYSYKKEDFHKNILTIIKGADFPVGVNEKDLASLLRQIANLYVGAQTKPLEDLGDILIKHGETLDAEKIYSRCLEMLENEDKPRVKIRLQKKIEKIKE